LYRKTDVLLDVWEHLTEETDLKFIGTFFEHMDANPRYTFRLLTDEERTDVLRGGKFAKLDLYEGVWLASFRFKNYTRTAFEGALDSVGG
jgi:protein gp37